MLEFFHAFSKLFFNWYSTYTKPKLLTILILYYIFATTIPTLVIETAAIADFQYSIRNTYTSRSNLEKRLATQRKHTSTVQCSHRRKFSKCGASGLWDWCVFPRKIGCAVGLWIFFNNNFMFLDFCYTSKSRK